MCPGSSGPFKMLSCYIKWVTILLGHIEVYYSTRQPRTESVILREISPFLSFLEYNICMYNTFFVVVLS